MTIESRTNKSHLRKALSSDILIMGSHHRKMFEDIFELNGERLGTLRAEEIEKAYIQKLETELKSGICKAWVIEDKGKIVSSGAITVLSLVPIPSDLSGNIAYLHSVYTDKPHRNKKYAQRIVRNAIEHCKSHGIKRILLNSSSEGNTVYQKFGFNYSPDAMRLFIE